jgi:hypothetical protein
VPAMEFSNTVDFDMTIEKDGQKVQERIAVKPFFDLRNPEGFDPYFYNPDVYGYEVLAANAKDRVDLVRSVEEKVLTKATEAFGEDLNGLSVDIRPNYDQLLSNNALVQECIDIAIEADPELVSNMEGIVKIRAKKDTYRVVHDAGLNIRDTIKGYEVAHDKNINSESYFIIINKPGEEPLAKTVAVDKNFSQDELKEFLKKEANVFINECVRNTDDLNGISVRAEKAASLSNEAQREFYRQIGSNTAEKGFENSVEIAR